MLANKLKNVILFCTKLIFEPYCGLRKSRSNLHVVLKLFTKFYLTNNVFVVDVSWRRVTEPEQIMDFFTNKSEHKCKKLYCRIKAHALTVQDSSPWLSGWDLDVQSTERRAIHRKAPKIVLKLFNRLKQIYKRISCNSFRLRHRNRAME